MHYPLALRFHPLPYQQRQFLPLHFGQKSQQDLDFGGGHLDRFSGESVRRV